MSSSDLPIIAGSVSTVIFVTSYLPMLVKAVRTKDLSSYSPANLLLTNLGNAVHSVYVYSLPAGPVWALHSFYLMTSALMLLWYVRYARRGVSPLTRPPHRPRHPLPKEVLMSSNHASIPEPHTLLTGLALESPRWHEGRLWFSDWGAQEVIAVDLEGRSEVVLRVPSFPFCMDRLPDGPARRVGGQPAPAPPGSTTAIS